MTHGGARLGAGRKSKAQEYRLFNLLDEGWPAADRVEFLRKVAEKARDGDLDAGRFLFSYAYGKPRECYLLENQPDSLDFD